MKTIVTDHHPWVRRLMASLGLLNRTKFPVGIAAFTVRVEVNAPVRVTVEAFADDSETTTLPMESFCLVPEAETSPTSEE